MKYLDQLLNKITMYRLVVYGLCALAAAGLLFSLIGQLSLSPTALVVSLGLLLLTSYVTEFTLAKIWNVPANSESWLITALILFLILQPPTDPATAVATALGGILASVSKYLISIRGKHIFNPAALAASVLSLTALSSTTWWVGSSSLWPFTLIIGALIVRKIRRFQIVLTFAAIALLVPFVPDILSGQLSWSSVHNALLISPLFFMGAVMLTEPATMPPRRKQQLIFAAGIAVLYATGWHIGKFYIYPEVALVLGNIYAFVVSPKFRLRLELKEIQRVSDRVYNYVFTPELRFDFRPGQYMEWTLPLTASDSRGNRRTFTIASSPTEADVQVGLKYYEPGSAFKQAFRNLRPGDAIYVSQLAGNFTIDGHEQDKLAFIAGGIGVTPFRSMIKYLMDEGHRADITLLHVVSDPAELAYASEFRQAAAFGIKYVPLVSERLNEDRLRQLLPDFDQRRHYISGPDAMVDAAAGLLRDAGVPANQIVRDHFSGY